MFSPTSSGFKPPVHRTAGLDSFSPRAKKGIALVCAAAIGLGAIAPAAADPPAQPFDDIDIVLMSTRAAARDTDPLLEQKLRTPDETHVQPGGIRYHYQDGAMDVFAKRSVTAEFLAPGAPRLHAGRVDPNQFSKKYPDGNLNHLLSEPFKECTQFAPDGACVKAEWNSIQYRNLSCVYENEATGETVRVLHRSVSDNSTSQMDLGVCAGHRLVKQDKWTVQPMQTDSQGNKLYVNPLHVISMEVVQP